MKKLEPVSFTALTSEGRQASKVCVFKTSEGWKATFTTNGNTLRTAEGRSAGDALCRLQENLKELRQLLDHAIKLDL